MMHNNRTFLASMPLLAVILAMMLPPLVLALPSGGNPVTDGVKIVTPDPSVPTSSMIVNTGSERAIIEWGEFSIGQGESVNFQQPGINSAVLNRVLDNQTTISGGLQSNGRVFLLNPSGFVFNDNAVINTAGFLATTLNIDNKDFLNNQYVFTGDEDSGGLVNDGQIQTTGSGGIYLIATDITNNGQLKTELGDILLATGQSFTFSSLDIDHIRFELQTPAEGIVNAGELNTSGGSMGLFSQAITNTGIIEATATNVDQSGNIKLMAESIISSRGSITASGGDILLSSDVISNTGNIEAMTSETISTGQIDLIAKTGIESFGTIKGVASEIGLTADEINLFLTSGPSSEAIHAIQNPGGKLHLSPSTEGLDIEIGGDEPVTPAGAPESSSLYISTSDLNAIKAGISQIDIGSNVSGDISVFDDINTGGASISTTSQGKLIANEGESIEINTNGGNISIQASGIELSNVTIDTRIPDLSGDTIPEEDTTPVAEIDLSDIIDSSDTMSTEESNEDVVILSLQPLKLSPNQIKFQPKEDSASSDSVAGSVILAPGSSKNILQSTEIHADSISLEGETLLDNVAFFANKIRTEGIVSSSSSTSQLGLFPLEQNQDITLGQDESSYLRSADMVQFSEFNGNVSIGGFYTQPAVILLSAKTIFDDSPSSAAYAGNITVSAPLKTQGNLEVVSLGDITINSGGLLQTEKTLSISALGQLNGSAGNISDASPENPKNYLLGHDLIIMANNNVGTLVNPLSVESSPNSISVGAGSGTAFLDGNPGTITPSDTNINKLYNGFGVPLNNTLNPKILTTNVADLSDTPDGFPQELYPPDDPPRDDRDEVYDTDSDYVAMIDDRSSFEQWHETGPTLRDQIDMNNLHVEGLMSPGAKIIVYIELLYDETTLVAQIGTPEPSEWKKLPYVTLRLNGTSHEALKMQRVDKNLYRVEFLPDWKQSAAMANFEIINATEEVQGDESRPYTIRAILVVKRGEDDPGKTGLDEEIADIKFGTPSMISILEKQKTNYGFISRTDYEKAEVNILRVDPYQRDIFYFVRRHPLPEGLREQSRSGSEWDGYSWSKTPSSGDHKLQVKGWNAEDWYVGWSDSEVTVQ